MTQLREDRTYRTRDGSRTGIRVKHHDRPSTWPWREADGHQSWNDNGWVSTQGNHPLDLIEDFVAPFPFSYAACPIVDGRRRAVTRDGREAVLLCDDAPGAKPIVGWIVGSAPRYWLANGCCSLSHELFAAGQVGAPTDLLVPPPPKRTLWINLAETGGYSTFNSEEEADQAATGCKRIGNRAVPVEVTV